MSPESEKLLRQAMEARRAGRHSDAKRHLAEAIAMLRENGAPAELAQALRTLGETERALNDNAAARQHYEESIAIYRGTAETLRLAHAIRHLGDIHHDDGNADLAEPFYQEALALYRSHQDSPPSDLANAIRSLAVLKSDAGDDEEADALWREARDLYQAANVQQGVAGSSVHLALLAQRRGDIEQARHLVQEAAVAAQASRDADSVRYVDSVRERIGGY